MNADAAPLRPVRAWLALGLFFVVFFAARQVATSAANLAPIRWSTALLDKGSYLVAMALVAGLVVAAARRVDRWHLRRGVIVGGWLLLALLSMPVFAATLAMIRALAGGLRPLEGGFAAAFFADLLAAGSTYLVLVIVVVIGDWGFRSYGTFVHERVAAARLAQELEREQLASISMRLDPEFVVSALASIRSRMPLEPAAAEDLLLELSDLLRRMLESDPEGRWPLREEVRFAAGYLHLALAGAPGAGEMPVVLEGTAWEPEVPTFLLRPWLEAAIHVARGNATSKLAAAIRPRSSNGELVIELRVEAEKGTRLATDSADGAVAFGLMRNRLLARFGDSVGCEQLNEVDSIFAVRVSLPAANEAAPRLPTSAGSSGEVVWKRA